jgi:hypothetical protein
MSWVLIKLYLQIWPKDSSLLTPAPNHPWSPADVFKLDQKATERTLIPGSHVCVKVWGQTSGNKYRLLEASSLINNEKKKQNT